MKIRTDFVSNSSSSSFIIKDNYVFEFFGITKEDIAKALIELIGKDKCEEYYNTHIKFLEESFKDCKDGNKHIEEYVKSHPNKNGMFEIFDMHDEDDSKLGHDRYDSMLSYWDATNTGKYKIWSMLEEVYSDLGIHQPRVDEGEKPYMSKYDYKAGKDTKMPDHLLKTWNFMRKELGIKTRKEVLSEEDSQYLIHFGDNDVYEVKGMAVAGKNEKYAKEEEKKDSIYETDSYSAERFFEVLINKLIEMKKIDPKNKEFLKEWLVPDDYWWKRDERHKDRVSFLDNPEEISSSELVDELEQSSEYCMHEG